MRYIKSDEVVSRNIEDETIILHLKTGNYYSLNEVGKLVWESLKDKPSFEKIIEKIEEVYEIPEKTNLNKDITELLDDLSKEGLIKEIE